MAGIDGGSFHYDFVWERASHHLQIMMHLLIHVFVCLWMNVTLTIYEVNNLNDPLLNN